MAARINQDDLFKLAREISRQYPILKCEQCADALVKAFKGQGLHGRKLKLTMRIWRGHIVVQDLRDVRDGLAVSSGIISENQQHFGVEVDDDGFVFDNILRTPKKRAEWVASFDCPCHEFDVAPVTTF